jgi:hypothetical protein
MNHQRTDQSNEFVTNIGDIDLMIGILDNVHKLLLLASSVNIWIDVHHALSVLHEGMDRFPDSLLIAYNITLVYDELSLSVARKDAVSSIRENELLKHHLTAFKAGLVEEINRSAELKKSVSEKAA